MMGLYTFVFIVLCLVTAMVIRVRDLEEEREGKTLPYKAPPEGVKTKGREDHF